VRGRRTTAEAVTYEFAQMASRGREAKRIARRQGRSSPGSPFPLLGWGIILAVPGVYAFVMKTPEEIMIERAERAEQRGAPV
jgi:hypothetical protein